MREPRVGDRDLRAEVLAEFASFASPASAYADAWERAAAALLARRRETNRRAQAAWRARQSKDVLRARKRAEYARNRAKRLGPQRARSAARRARLGREALLRERRADYARNGSRRNARRSARRREKRKTRSNISALREQERHDSSLIPTRARD